MRVRNVTKGGSRLTKLTGETQINSSKEEVWAVLADLRTVQHYDLGVSGARYTSEAEGVWAPVDIAICRTRVM